LGFADSNYFNSALGLAGFGVMNILAAFCCPDGCCGEYKRKDLESGEQPILQE